MAATLTGSHIKGASSGANIEAVLVNPTAGGMAELAVAMAGSYSGYVVQTDAETTRITNLISADIGRGESRNPTSQDRPSANDRSDETGAGFEQGLSMIDVPTAELKTQMRSDNPEDRVAAAEAAIEYFGIKSVAGYTLEYDPNIEPYAMTWPSLRVVLGPRSFESWSTPGSTLGHEIEIHVRQFVEHGNMKSNREFARREVEAHGYNLRKENIDRFRNLAPEIHHHQRLLARYIKKYEESR